MKKLLHVVILLSLLLFSFSCDRKENNKNGSSHRRENKFIVLVEHRPPHFYIENGEWTGMDVELVKAVINETGLEAEFRELPGQKSVKDFKEGNLDVILSVNLQSSLIKFGHLVGPQRMKRMTLAVNKKYRDLPIYTIGDLTNTAGYFNRKIILQSNVSYSPAMERQMKEDPRFASHFAFVADSDELFRIAEADRGIGFFEEYFTLAYRIRGSLEYSNLRVHNFVLSTEPVYFGLSQKASPEKRRLFTKAFFKLEKNGTLEKLRTKWKRMYHLR